MGYVDLHVHTTHSDGALSPAQMVEKAKAAGVTTLAIADHDKISGSQEAAPLCARAGIRLIPAAEVDTVLRGVLVHVLAYFPDFANAAFLAMLQDSRAKLDGMSDILIDRLAARGKNVSREEYAFFPEMREKGGWKALYYLAHKGIVAAPKQALRLYGDYGVRYADQGFIATENAIRVIHESGGQAVLAHPRETFGDPLEKQVRQALELAFDGIECHYPRHDRKTTWLLRTLCREKGLYETCGSDDHGGFSGADVGSLKITALPAGW